jgi:hypothetical protein
MPPSVPPTATGGNKRSPSACVNKSLASDQNCAMASVPKMPSHTKNTKPMRAFSEPSTASPIKLSANALSSHTTSRLGSTRVASST